LPYISTAILVAPFIHIAHYRALAMAPTRSFSRFILGAFLLASFHVLAAAPLQGAGKAVWEPINYPKDIGIGDVFFVDESTGWICGGRSIRNGFLMGTTDGGGTWTLQAGDPDGEDREYSHLRFVDRTHGWVIQRTGSEANLFATRDGQQWDLVGKLPEHFSDIAFTTPTDGFAANGDRLFVTHDGGATWAQMNVPQTQAEVDGLTRSVRCEISSISFPTPTDGYAVGGSYEASGMVFLLKTQDGGETWTPIASKIGEGKEAKIFFTDPTSGTLRTRDSNIFSTTDGGETWRGVPGTAGPLLRFADPEVGWSFHYRKFSYSIDGGKRWTSREVQFPQPVEGFSLPKRDLAYVVGDHGMIYRYRFVEGADAPKRAIAAPPMPPLTAEVEPTAKELSGDVAELSGSLGQAQEPGGASSSAQNVVDAATSIPFIQKCCKTQLTQISNLIQNLVRDTPQIIGKYRNLNLVSLGLKLVLELPSRLEGIQTAFAELRKAPDAQSALNASANLATAVDAFRSSLTDESPAAGQASTQ
jgi:photosystem II stability/assembly factor-like uncharacterized protein